MHLPATRRPSGSSAQRWARGAVLVLALFLGGCAALPVGLLAAASAAGSTASAVAVYQRYEDRQAQIDQNKVLERQVEKLERIDRSLGALERVLEEIFEELRRR